MCTFGEYFPYSLKYCKSEPFLGLFRSCKSTKFLGVPVRKSQIRKFSWLICKMQIRKFLQNNAQLCHKTVLILFLKWFSYFVQILIRALYVIFVRRISMCLQTVGSFESAKKSWVCKWIYKLKSASHKKRLGSLIENPQGATMSGNLTNYLRPQIYGFAICRTNLRTALGFKKYKFTNLSIDRIKKTANSSA